MKNNLIDIIAEWFFILLCIIPLLAVAMLGFFHITFFFLGVV